jgi:hypothetical protein
VRCTLGIGFASSFRPASEEFPMDGPRFDGLTRRLADSHSRRGVVSRVGRLVLVGAVALVPWSESAAKRKKGKKRKQRPDETGPSCPAGQRLCRGTCLSVLICCDDTDCAGGRTCQNGTCACPASRPHVCTGSTLCQQCCSVTDCRPGTADDGQACQNGQCVCTQSGDQRCPAGTERAGYCGRCCDHGDCPAAELCLDGSRNNDRLDLVCTCDDAQCPLGNGQSVCVPDGCRDKCFRPCNVPGQPQAGQPCCSGKGAWVCYEVSPGDFQCAPPDQQ